MIVGRWASVLPHLCRTHASHQFSPLIGRSSGRARRRKGIDICTTCINVSDLFPSQAVIVLGAGHGRRRLLHIAYCIKLTDFAGGGGPATLNRCRRSGVGPAGRSGRVVVEFSVRA